jgi:hypothetical protein
MIEEWKNGLMVLALVGIALAGGAMSGGLLWGFAVVLPAELLSDDAVWLERYFTHAAVIGAGTAGVRALGQMARRGSLGVAVE